MKHLSNLTLLLLISCTPQMQLVTVKSTNQTIEDNNLVFQDSLVKITYDFYSPNGTLKFQIQNKYNKPIFIDWKNSMYIVASNQRFSYWNDESNFSGKTYETNVEWTSWLSNASGSIKGKMSKEERISFLPPATAIQASKFHVANGIKFNMNGESEITYDKNNWRKTKKQVKITHSKFNIENTPLQFRNYIAISLEEDFKQPIYYDFEFWISEIQEMSAKQLVGHSLFKTYMNAIVSGSKFHPYKKSNFFFIKEK